MVAINIFQNVYVDANEERQQELNLCNSYNLNLTYSSKIPIHFIAIKERPTFNRVFSLTKNYPESINIIANSDIYFRLEDIEKMIGFFEMHGWNKKVCMALTRWDDDYPDSPRFFHRADSQDTWVFYGAVPNIEGADFYVGGVAGCDNKIAYLLKENGYELHNPSLSIKTYHLHKSGVRNYIVDGKVKDRVPPPYFLVEPYFLP